MARVSNEGVPLSVLLRDWSVVVSPKNTFHLQGIVYHHPKIEDGEEIISSEIQNYDADKGTCQTKNTLYTLEGFDLNAVEFEVTV
jgi:hypothetical protein